VERIAQREIELVLVGRREHQAEVIAVSPICLGADLFPHPVEEGSSWKWIREGDTYVVRACVTHQRNRLLDVLPLLPGIAELQEIACVNACVPQARPRVFYLCDTQTLIHGVEHSLRSGFDSHPHFGAARPFQAVDCVPRHKVGAGLNLERQPALERFHGIGEFLDPVLIQGKDVIPKPDMFNPIYFLELTDLSRNQLR
jgi:hypothetical protein